MSEPEGRSSALGRLLIPTLPRVLGVAIFAVCAATPFASQLISADGDFSTHVLHGQAMLASGGLLSSEPSTLLTPGRPLVAHEWLSQLLLGAAESLAGGPEGPVLLMSALLALTFALTLRRALREASPWPALAALVLAVLVARLHMLARPHVFTWLLAALWTAELIRLQRGEIGWRRWLALALPLIVLWTNLHGGFALGFFLLGLFGLARLHEALTRHGEARGRASLAFGQLFGSGFLLLAASGLNPSGFELHTHILEHLGSPELVLQREFDPPVWSAPEHRPSVVLLLTIALALLRGARRPQAWEWTLALGLGVLACTSARNLPVLAILFAPVLARRLQLLVEGSKRAGRGWAAALEGSSSRLAALERGHGGALTTGAVCLAIALAVGVLKVPPVAFDPEKLPVAATEWVAEQPQLAKLDVLASYHWGGYVSRVLAPRKVLANGLADHFGVDAMRAFLAIDAAQPGWDDALASYGVGLAIYEQGTPLCEALERSPRWRLIHHAGQAKVFVAQSQ